MYGKVKPLPVGRRKKIFVNMDGEFKTISHEIWYAPFVKFLNNQLLIIETLTCYFRLSVYLQSLNFCRSRMETKKFQKTSTYVIHRLTFEKKLHFYSKLHFANEPLRRPQTKEQRTEEYLTGLDFASKDSVFL